MRILPLVLLAIAATASAANAPIGIGPIPSPAVQYYLEIPEIPGESTSRGFENQMEAQSFSWGETNTAKAGSQSTGAGAGKVTFNPFSITRKIDKASPVLMKVCAQGKHFPKAILHVARTSDGRRFEYLTLTLENVFVTSYQIGGAGPTDLPTESLSLNFSKISFAERSQLADGSVAPAVTATFDVAADKAE